MSDVLILYVPVLHEGYLKLLARLRGQIDTLYLPSRELLAELVFLEPEIRAIDPRVMAGIIRASGLVPELHVEVMTPGRLPDLTGRRIITVDEGFSHRLVEHYYPDNEVVLDTVFLRWDEASVLKTAPAGYDRISHFDIDRKLMELAATQAEESGDWWRQVGAVLAVEAQPVVATHNRHVPSQLSPYAEGDPRDFVPAGTDAQIATALHGEQSLIAEAARRGISTEGAEIYVTVFPCPVCAKLIAYSGIRCVYFRTGHASLDGQRILHDRGVEIVLVP